MKFRFPAQMFSVDDDLSSELSKVVDAALETLYKDEQNVVNCNPPFAEGSMFGLIPGHLDFIEYDDETVVIAIRGYDYDGKHIMDFPILRTSSYMTSIFPQVGWGHPMVGEA